MNEPSGEFSPQPSVPSRPSLRQRLEGIIGLSPNHPLPPDVVLQEKRREMEGSESDDKLLRQTEAAEAAAKLPDTEYPPTEEPEDYSDQRLIDASKEPTS